MKFINPLNMINSVSSAVFFGCANLFVAAFNLGIALGMGSVLNLILGIILLIVAYGQIGNIYDSTNERDENDRHN